MYPHPAPDSAVLVFLPGIVSIDGVDFGSAFSPDGKTFYFARSTNKKLKLYSSWYNGTEWTTPSIVSFIDTLYSQADPAFGPDGSLYFISNRPRDATDQSTDYDIWYVSPMADGRWSEPYNLEAVNTDSSEFYISFARNGSLYFSSSRRGGFGEEDIYVSRLTGKTYGQPVNLGSTINTARSEYDPGISPNGQVLVFASSGRTDSYGAADLYRSLHDKTHGWGPTLHLGNKINTSTRDYCPYWTPDGRYFIFSSAGDIKWIPANRMAPDSP